jgi:dimethylaniline monooxygenase (N-oxide forming)
VYSLLWDVRLNDEGFPTPDGFFALANSGKIKLVAPARCKGYASDGSGVLLTDGRVLRADAVILATGYTSSWDGLLGTSLFRRF